MKVWILIPMLLVMAAPRCWTAGRTAATTVETFQVAGKRYLRLNDWARANNFDLHWIKRDELLQLTNRTATLTFAKDSRDAELNGIEVCLSYPIVVRNGGAYVAEVDMDTAIRPVLTPPKNWSGAKIKTIVIDPGHGGKDPGFQLGSQPEKKYTLLLAQELRDQLNKAGFNASLTRTTDTFVELSERPDIARRRGADLFISVHWNSSPVAKNEVKGAQIFCLTPAGASSSNAGGEIRDAGTKPGNRNNEKNMFLAYSLQKNLVNRLGVEDRGVRRARYAVLTPAEMPAVLIEGGFMSHPDESKRIYDPDYRRRMAQAIVQGVQAYQREVEIVKPKP